MFVGKKQSAKKNTVKKSKASCLPAFQADFGGMALSLSRAFGAMGTEKSKFDRRKVVADPELGLLSSEDMAMAQFMLPGDNQVRGSFLRASGCACAFAAQGLARRARACFADHARAQFPSTASVAACRSRWKAAVRQARTS